MLAVWASVCPYKESAGRSEAVISSSFCSWAWEMALLCLGFGYPSAPRRYSKARFDKRLPGVIFFFKSHLMCISKRKHFWGCICSAEEMGLSKEDVYTTWKKYLVCVAVSVLSQLVSTSNSPTELYKLILYCVLTKLLRFVVSVKFTFFFPPLLYQWLC